MAEENIIPVIGGGNPEGNPEDVNGQMDVEEVLDTIEQELNEEQRNMVSLCDQVSNFGIQPQNVQVDKGIDSTFTLLVLTNTSIGKDKYIHEKRTVRWVCFDATTLVATNQVVMRFINDPTSKRVIIDCYAKFLLTEPAADVMEAVRSIRNAAATVYNSYICFSSGLFPPQLELMWGKIADFNLFTRNINISMRMSPLSNHKSVLKKGKGLAKLACKGECWIEKVNNTGLGLNLSELGQERLQDWFNKHLLNGMSAEVSHNTSCTVNDGTPCALQFTPGYKTPEMVLLLKQLGSFVEGAPVPRKENWGKQAKGNNKRDQDVLHPKLSVINRRTSTSSSSSGSSRRSSYVAPRYNKGRDQGDLLDQVNLVKIQRDNTDLQNVIFTLKAERQKEDQERRSREDQHIARVDHLHRELEHLGTDRRSLASKLLKAESDYLHVRDERDRLQAAADRRRDRGRESDSSERI